MVPTVQTTTRLVLHLRLTVIVPSIKFRTMARAQMLMRVAVMCI
jgi:hypothetical protein